MLRSPSARFASAIVAGVLIAGACAYLQGRQAQPPLALGSLKLPPGFHISIYADNVPGAREMTLGANGTLFVGTKAEGKVYALRDLKGQHKIDDVKVIASGLDLPNGVAFRNGSLYVSAPTRIVRLDKIESKLDAPPVPVVVYEGFPHEAATHDWRFIAFGPDDKLYASIGAPCNVCEPKDAHSGTILQMNPDGSGLEVFAHGVRDSVGFDWSPATHELWFTDNGRDLLGDDVPNDELNVAWKPGLDFGFPYCFQGDVSDPDFGKTKPCSASEPPVQMMGPHVAAIGMRFYTGTMFPASWRDVIFIAQHGSWNRSIPIGYRVMAAHVNGRKVTKYESFVDGFLVGSAGTAPGGRTNGAAMARPVDVLTLKDGSLLVSDDSGGRIFRITYGSAK